MCRYRCKHLDHADNGTEQPEQRRDRSDSTQGLKITLKLVHNMASRIFDRILQNDSIPIPVNQASGQYLSKRGSLVQRLNLLLIELVFPDPTPDLAGQVFRDDTFLLQGPESFKNDTHSDNRTQNNRQHQPAAGLNYLNHRNLNDEEKGNIQ